MIIHISDNIQIHFFFGHIIGCIFFFYIYIILVGNEVIALYITIDMGHPFRFPPILHLLQSIFLYSIFVY